MPAPRHTDAEVAEAVKTHGLREAARRLGYADSSSLGKRRRNIENKTGRQIRGKPHPGNTRLGAEPPGRIHQQLNDGVVLVGSDAHYWPDVITTAHRAFVHFCREYRPAVVVMNGDAFDGASVSRHSPIMWEEKPAVIRELEACQERLGEIEKAVPKGTRRIWTLGNHDARFETRLATQAPEYAGLHGMHLKDHFDAQWEPCWSLWINEGEAVIKHREAGGIHATHNNTLKAGLTTVTGHLHSLKVTPFTDYRGTRWGVDTGTLADPFGPQFQYLEDGVRNWRGGFAFLTFRNGRLLWPEVVNVMSEGEVCFRGKVISV